jgi:hypothetical protein
VGVIHERAVKFVIAASIALAIMCFQSWWSMDLGGGDVPYQLGGASESISGTGTDAVTGLGDGTVVLICALVTGVLGFLALLKPSLHRWLGMTVTFLAALMGILTSIDILSTPTLQFLGGGALNPGLVDVNYHATPILYFAAVTSGLIALAGLVLAFARDERVEARERIEAWV